MKPTHQAVHCEQVRRRADGSIDIEFYRRRAVMLRSQMISNAAATIWRTLISLRRIRSTISANPASGRVE
jgi:hypothetical protein